MARMGEKLPGWKRQRIIQLVKEDTEIEFIVERLDVSKQTIYNTAAAAGFPIAQWYSRGYEPPVISRMKRKKTGGRQKAN